MTEECVNNKMESKKRHAYCIMAHNNFNLLKILLECLDDERNDIYLHIGSDVKNVDFNDIVNTVKHTKIYLTEKRLDVKWGNKSQVDVTLLLLNQAYATSQYTYYHFISGVDLPIKSQNYIHTFFEDNENKNFISGSDKITDNSNKKMISRIKYYHYFTGIRTRGKMGRYIVAACDMGATVVQKMIKIDRLKNYPQIYFGSQWFSISSDFTKYIIDNQELIESMCKYTRNSDELVFQTLGYNSPFKSSITGKDLRYTDWERGNGPSPYTFGLNDFNELKEATDELFARKFDEKKDGVKLALMIKNQLCND